MSWLEECIAVTSSYENWSNALRCDEPLAFGAHVAALDREEVAAASYRQAIKEITLIQVSAAAVKEDSRTRQSLPPETARVPGNLGATRLRL